MATTSKKATKSATKRDKNTVTNPQNTTRVVCPECGAEFDILAQHEHTVKNAVVLGQDSGLGTIYLPVSKRGEALQAAGIDTRKFFSIPKQDGTEQLMTYDAAGIPVAVDADDPVIKSILGGGTVPNRSLFRRWIMSQVFHGLQADGGFTSWLRCHGYPYQWEMLIEELHVQAKLYGKDMENYEARNRWFNKGLCVKMAEDYIDQLRKDAQGRSQHKCKGVPYVTVEHVMYFVSDIEKKLIQPLKTLALGISHANTPQALEERVRKFWKQCPVKSWSYDQCAEWKDAYKGMGAYATMQNLLRFHGCSFPRNNSFRSRNATGLECLEKAATAYGHDGMGWRLFGLMKQCIDENHIDIAKKMKEWAKAKKSA